MDWENGLPGGQCSVNKNIRFKLPMLRSDLCDYSDVYIAAKGKITVTGTDNADRSKNLTFKNNLQVRSNISKINNTFIGNAEDLDTDMSMYNFLEYSGNCFMTSGSLWNYHRELNDHANKIDAADNNNENNKK